MISFLLTIEITFENQNNAEFCKTNFETNFMVSPSLPLIFYDLNSFILLNSSESIVFLLTLFNSKNCLQNKLISKDCTKACFKIPSIFQICDSLVFVSSWLNLDAHRFAGIKDMPLKLPRTTTALALPV